MIRLLLWREQSDLGPYGLQYRQQTKLQTTKVMTDRKGVKDDMSRFGHAADARIPFLGMGVEALTLS